MKAADLPLRYNAAEILDHNLDERAEKLALTGPAGNRPFGQAAEEANRVGRALLELGLRPGDRVAILMSDRPEWPACFFGTLKAGGIALGMNTLLTPGEQGQILHDSGARVLIAERTSATWIASGFRESVGELPALEHVVWLGPAACGGEHDYPGAEHDRPGAETVDHGVAHDYRALTDAFSGELNPAPTTRDDLATLNYSSGTTGAPKGIPHAHKDLALCAELWGVRCLGLREDDLTYSNAKLFFTYGLGGGLVFPWAVGAGTVLNPGPARETEAVLEVIDRYRPTIFYNAPTGYAAMLARPELAGSHDLSSLRVCVSAGEALPAPIWQAWKETTGLELVDGIGSTEMFHIFISNRPGTTRPGSSGTPVEGYECRVVGETGQPVKPGVVGHLWVRGESAAPGYWSQEELTRRTFVSGWVDTGDKYRVDEDGFYSHAGRADDMLKVGGIWVSPVEVEGCLSGHPAVQECAVVGVPDRDGLIKPKAWVVTRPGHAGGAELEAELIAYCAGRLAAYKRPRRIAFTETLPRTATGKIRRFRLRGVG